MQLVCKEFDGSGAHFNSTKKFRGIHDGRIGVENYKKVRCMSEKVHFRVQCM